MPNIGDSERKAQNRVVKFFRDMNDDSEVERIYQIVVEQEEY